MVWGRTQPSSPQRLSFRLGGVAVGASVSTIARDSDDIICPRPLSCQGGHAYSYTGRASLLLDRPLCATAQTSTLETPCQANDPSHVSFSFAMVSRAMIAQRLEEVLTCCRGDGVVFEWVRKLISSYYNQKNQLNLIHRCPTVGM